MKTLCVLRTTDGEIPRERKKSREREREREREKNAASYEKNAASYIFMTIMKFSD